MSFSPLFTDSPTPQDKDLATLSNYLDARTTHIDLDWAIDWQKKIIGGSATVTLEATKDVEKVVLDTSYLDVQGVEVDGTKAVSGGMRRVMVVSGDCTVIAHSDFGTGVQP
jgi:leukotriene-A4 hydrolase